MGITEPLQGTLYWREVRNGLFVHNENWNSTIERLPSLISSSFVLSKLQTTEQILQSGFRGLGTIGPRFVQVQPDAEALRTGLIGNTFSVENLFLQWLYQFYLIESIGAHYQREELPNWPKAFIDLADDCLHVMTYVAALIFLYDETALKAVVTEDNLRYTEIMVKDKVAQLTSTLYAKCAEYGESFRRHGLQGTLPRLWDKAARYAQLSALGRSATYEPKLDSAKDLLGYCLIAWSLIHEFDTEEHEDRKQNQA